MAFTNKELRFLLAVIEQEIKDYINSADPISKELLPTASGVRSKLISLINLVDKG